MNTITNLLGINKPRQIDVPLKSIKQSIKTQRFQKFRLQF